MNSENKEMPVIGRVLGIKDKQIGIAINDYVRIIAITFCGVALIGVLFYGDQLIISRAALFLAGFSAIAQISALLKLGKALVKALPADQLNLLLLATSCLMVTFFIVTVYAFCIFWGVVLSLM